MTTANRGSVVSSHAFILWKGSGNQRQQDETSDSNWISTEDSEEDKKEISLFDSSSEEEMVTNLVHQLLQTTLFPKPKRGKNTFCK